MFFNEIDEKFQKKEKLKARKLRASQWWKRKRSTGICHYCGKKFSPKELTMDHLIPISKGGRSIKINLVPCCKECNTKKHSMLPLEWKEYMNSLTGCNS
jgi:5-methylcytosine-specific restriction endonuclease McrA